MVGIGRREFIAALLRLVLASDLGAAAAAARRGGEGHGFNGEAD
jgi:hypothetical protein